MTSWSFSKMSKQWNATAYVYIFKFLIWLWLRIVTKIFKALAKSSRSRSVESHIVLEMGSLQWVWSHIRLPTIAAGGPLLQRWAKVMRRRAPKVSCFGLHTDTPAHRHTHMLKVTCMFSFCSDLDKRIYTLSHLELFYIFVLWLHRKANHSLSKLLNLKWFLHS